MVDSKISSAVVGGIDHGADVIQMVCHIPVGLSHSVRIHPAAYDSAEHVGCHKDALVRQPVISIFNEFRNNVLLAPPVGVSFVIDHIVHATLRGKADIVKLHLVKSGLAGLNANLHKVVPYLLLVRVHPRQTFAVPVDAPVRQL